MSDPNRGYADAAPSGAAPHRGTLVLVLGIVGFAIACIPLGIVAWVLGQSDLKAMKEGRMDPSGMGVTQAGYIIGMISVLLYVVIFFGAFIVGMLLPLLARP